MVASLVTRAVDASGDATVAWHAGQEVREPETAHWGTQMVTLENFDREAVASFHGFQVAELLKKKKDEYGLTRADGFIFDDQVIPAGSRVLLLYGSANRDERKWDDPERFDVSRDNRDHLGFGFGAHICVGMHLARLEITALMKAFAKRVSRFELGEPERAMSNILRGFDRLPVTVH